MTHVEDSKLDAIAKDVKTIKDLLTGPIDDPSKGLVSQVQQNARDIRDLRERDAERKRHADRITWAAVSTFISSIIYAFVGWLSGR